MNNKYQEVLAKNGKGESNLTVYVLSQGQWPQSVILILRIQVFSWLTFLRGDYRYKQLQKGWEKMTLPPKVGKGSERCFSMRS
jgi:hypothetical protein